jgi:phospholipase/carboxylesterase
VREEVPEGIEQARDQLVETIDLVLKQCKLDESSLLLGGFSQGAMLSVETACLGLANPPKQLCLYSGALICEKRWKPALGKLKQTQIFQSHGRMDPILPLQTGQWLRDLIKQSGCSVDYFEFNGPHTIPYEAIEYTGKMLAELVV